MPPPLSLATSSKATLLEILTGPRKLQLPSRYDRKAFLGYHKFIDYSLLDSIIETDVIMLDFIEQGHYISSSTT